MRRRALVLALFIAILCLLCAGCTVSSIQNESASSTGAAPKNARMLGLILDEQDDCVTVLAVRTGSAADGGGLQPGDIVRQANGTAVHLVRELNEQIRHASELNLTVERNEELFEVILPLSAEET